MRLEFDFDLKIPSHSPSKSAASYLTHTSRFHPENFSLSKLGYHPFAYLRLKKKPPIRPPTQVTALSPSAPFLFSNNQRQTHMHAYTRSQTGRQAEMESAVLTHYAAPRGEAESWYPLINSSSPGILLRFNAPWSSALACYTSASVRRPHHHGDGGYERTGHQKTLTTNTNWCSNI